LELDRSVRPHCFWAHEIFSTPNCTDRRRKQIACIVRSINIEMTAP
jgi:hypothetical protein